MATTVFRKFVHCHRRYIKRKFTAFRQFRCQIHPSKTTNPPHHMISSVIAYQKQGSSTYISQDRKAHEGILHAARRTAGQPAVAYVTSPAHTSLAQLHRHSIDRGTREGGFRHPLHHSIRFGVHHRSDYMRIAYSSPQIYQKKRAKTMRALSLSMHLPYMFADTYLRRARTLSNAGYTMSLVDSVDT